MSLWSRIANVFRGNRLNQEIDEELASHVQEAIDDGREPEAAQRALGSPLRLREQSRDVRLVAWLDSLRSDAIFGWRQLNKTRITSFAAILSLALAIGACTSAFRLIDALFFRPLPVAGAERLYAVTRQGLNMDGQPGTFDGTEYPLFQIMRDTVHDDAKLLAVSYADRTDITYSTDQDMEKAVLQYVSGELFDDFRLRPALGRLLESSDDQTPGTHPYAVLSYDYWVRRFGQDKGVLGHTFQLGNQHFEIIGVAEKAFTGTEPGTIVDIFVPAMMNEGVTHANWSWLRVLAQLNPGVAADPVRKKLQVNFSTFQEERMKELQGIPKQKLQFFLDQKIVLEPARAGVSELQKENRPALAALGVLVLLVLFIACANVANLMAAQAAARTREMALRVSIGAGRSRLIQLVLLQSAWIALLASALGGLFAWWSAPFVVGKLNPPDFPARIALPADWRVLAFALALTLFVTIVLGILPALRASSVKPASALKGGDNPNSRRRLMHVMIAAQVAFCFLVLFVAGLFVGTFERLSHLDVGFSANRLLTLQTDTKTPQVPEYWDQVAARLQSVPGVEQIAFSQWPLLNGFVWNGFVSIDGPNPSPVLAHFLDISPGWIATMKIPLVAGRDFLPTESSPDVAIVNEAFVKQYLNGENPLGRTFTTPTIQQRTRIVGVVRNSHYQNLRETTSPVVYVPFRRTDESGALVPRMGGTFIVRTANSNPLALASTLRQEVSRARSEFRVSNIRTQQEIIDSHTVRERLLAMLATFFSVVALLLAGIGLYGVLHYSVLQRRREIGIRMAVGARGANIARLVSLEIFSMVLAGAVAGLALGMLSVHYIEALFYQVKATDASMLAFPALTILAAALLAAVAPVLRAIRIDPARMLRAE